MFELLLLGVRVAGCERVITRPDIA